MSKEIIVLDIGLGNTGSVQAAVSRLGCRVLVLNEPKEVRLLNSGHLILPGVGSFSEGMRRLSEGGWDKWLKDEWVPSGRNTLGICLGMQLLLETGEEGVQAAGEKIDGLGLVGGTIERLSPQEELYPLPHIGWNNVYTRVLADKLMSGIETGEDFYFVHSYALIRYKSEQCIATSDYGGSFCSVVKSGKTYGVQFHPEKSQRIGARLLRNFVDMP